MPAKRTHILSGLFHHLPMHHQNSFLGNMLEANQLHTSLAFKLLMSRRHLACSILLYWGVTIFVSIACFSNYSVCITENFESAYSSCFVGSRTSSLPSGFFLFLTPSTRILTQQSIILKGPWVLGQVQILVVVSFPRNETLKNPPRRILLGRKILLRN